MENMDNNFEELLQVLKSHSEKTNSLTKQMKQMKQSKGWKIWNYIPSLPSLSSKTESKNLQPEASSSLSSYSQTDSESQEVKTVAEIIQSHSEKTNSLTKPMKQSKGWKIWNYIPSLPSLSSKTESKNLQPEASSSLSSYSQTDSESQEVKTVAEIIQDIKQRLEIVENEIEEAVKRMVQSAVSTAEKEAVQPPVIQIYERDGNTADFVMAFTERIQNRFLPVIVKDVTEVDKNKPILILCQRRSRLVPDIDYSREHFEDFGDSRVAIVVIHSKEQHALQNISSQSKLSGKEQYKNVWFIDIAFTKELKFYECEMNTEAIVKLQNFLTSRSDSVV